MALWRFFFEVVVRRWYILILGLLATAGICYGTALLIPVTYTAKALVLILPSAETVGEGGNPLLSLSGLEQPASLVVAQLNSAESDARVAAFAPTAAYTISMDDSTRGPVIAIEASGPNPDVTLATQRYLASEVVTALATLQSEVGAPSRSLVTSTPLVMDQVAQPNTTPTLRVLIAAGIGGITLTLLAAFAIDGRTERRFKTRSSPSPGSPSPSRRANARTAPTDEVEQQPDPPRLPAASATSRRLPAE